MPPLPLGGMILQRSGASTLGALTVAFGVVLQVDFDALGIEIEVDGLDEPVFSETEQQSVMLGEIIHATRIHKLSPKYQRQKLPATKSEEEPVLKRQDDKTVGQCSQKGVDQWVEVQFEENTSLNSFAVYWVDQGTNIRAPKSWQLEIPEGDGWKPLTLAAETHYGNEIDQWNVVRFAEPVRTERLRIAISPMDDKCVGILATSANHIACQQKINASEMGDAFSSNNDRLTFIFFITDDISPGDIGPYGNGFVETPNLDEMARRGLVFDNAYLTISSCSPSRCSIITGRYPHNTGAPELHAPLPEPQHTFVEQLRDAGYHTVISGKNYMAKDHQTLGFVEASDSKPAGSENWVQHLRQRPADQPFFGWFASHDAHHLFDINDEAPTYDPANVPVPPMMADGPGTREELAGYYHEVSRTDFDLGKLMAELKRQGISDNTYVFYLSDNGRPFPRCKTYLYDSGIKTPLLIAGPGVKAGRTDALVLLRVFHNAKIDA